MIQSLKWLLRALFFCIVLGFALANADIVQVQFIGFETVWRAPLVVFLAGFFAAGMIVGLLALTPTMFTQRREINKLSKSLKQMKPAEEPGDHGAVTANPQDRRGDFEADRRAALPDRPHGV